MAWDETLQVVGAVFSSDTGEGKEDGKTNRGGAST